MKRIIIICTAVLLCYLQPVLADEFSVGDITISDPWARALPSVSANGATYVTLINNGNVADRLIAASTPIARMSHLHTHIMKDDVAKMRQIDAVDLPASESVVFKPGMGFHVMMMNLEEPLIAGKTFTMILSFERAGDVSIVVSVKK